MLLTAVVILSLSVAFGTVLALWHLRASEGRPRPPLMIGLLHGALAAIGVAAAALLLRGPARGTAMGAGAFGAVSVALFVAALVVGVIVRPLARRQALVANGAIVLHAGLAITGYVLFLAWSSLS